MTYSVTESPTFRLTLLIIVLLVAAALRLADIRSLPVWMDEVYSYWFSNLGWSYLWNEVPRFENHPPAYFLVLKAWRTLAGESEAALRLPSVLASLGSVLALFFAGRAMGEGLGKRRTVDGWTMGLLAAALAALSQFEITFAGEARPYAFASLGISVMLAGTLRILCGTADEPDGTRSLPAAATLVLGMAVTLWSHSLGLVPAGLTGLFLIGWWATVRHRDGGTFLRLAAMAAAVAVLCWPHFVNTVAQFSRDYSAFWIEAPSFYELFMFTYQAAGLHGLPFGPMVEALVAALMIGGGLAGLWRRGMVSGKAAAIALLPVVLAGGYWIVVVAYTYLSQPVLLARTLIYIHPPVVLIVAALPWALAQGRARSVLGAAVVTLAALAALGPNELHPGSRSYGEIARRIATEDASAPILAMPGEAEILLGFYEDHMGVDFDIRPIPGPFPPMNDGLPDLINPPEVSPEILARAVKTVEDAPVVWLVVRKRPEERETLRALMRDSGWSEELLIGPPSERNALFIRYVREGAGLQKAGN